jgi:thioredoxin-related protein
MKTIFTIFAFLVFSFSNAQKITNHFEEIQKNAKQLNKNILIIFSGSDWCAPCIKLDRNVFQTETFKKTAIENWIVVKADFPRKKANQLTKEQTENNRILAEKYNKEGSFPLVVLINHDGKVIKKMGFKNCSVQEYIQELLNTDK